MSGGGILGGLARYARPIVLLDAALIFGGILLTSFNMLLVGWSVYAAGHVLAIIAFLTLAAAHRERMDGWSWTGLLVLELGLILALPQVASIWRSYYDTPTGALMLVPAQAAPIGPAADALTWIGLAFFGLAARGAKALPAGIGWVFLVAAIIGLLAQFVNVLVITPYWWVVAVLVLVVGLVGAGASLQPASRRAAEPARAL